MNRAAWRRDASFTFQGGRYIGTLGFLSIIAEYLKTHNQITERYGVRKPRREMPNSETDGGGRYERP